MVSSDPVDQPKLYSTGDCPVCADSGAVLLLKRADLGTMVFFCPLCGVAWNEPPGDRLDEIVALDSLAPNGVTLPTELEASSTGLLLKEVPLEDWIRLLQDVLHSEA